ncbi:MAG: hypothetical protein NTZ69_16070 [Bacteroidia bacterium]|nr:hypothetical protein [Bacteroidia bacterium]
MTIRKIKVSALPEASTFEGLIVLGIDSSNNSVKAPMSVLKGNKGDAATVAISSTVIASAPGSSPAVVNEGTSYAAILKFTLPSGQNVEFQKSSTHIQWRVVGTVNWANLVPLTDIKGDNVSMQMSATHVQYQVGSAGWINLISIAALQQPAADATSAANTAAGLANTKAGIADASASNADSKATLANNAASLANSKAGLADTAAGNADSKATLANTKAGLADTAATNADAKATLANNAATAANAAAANASDKAALADSKATLANTKAGLADTAATNADAKAVSAYTVQLRLEALEASLVAQYKAMPTSMTLSYPNRITNRNRAVQKISSTLAPTGTGSNVLFLGDNNAVTTYPDGGFTINKAGHSVIHCIPTENTSLYKTITIDVVEPVMRKVAAASLRFLANGKIRLT